MRLLGFSGWVLHSFSFIDGVVDGWLFFLSLLPLVSNVLLVAAWLGNVLLVAARLGNGWRLDYAWAADKMYHIFLVGDVLVALGAGLGS